MQNYRTGVLPSSGARTPESNLRSPNYRGSKSELCVLGIEKRLYSMKLMLPVIGGKSLLYHGSIHWTDSFKTVDSSWTSKNGPLNHWTDSFKSLDLFSLQCVDVRNSSCGLSGTVDSSAAKMTKYRVINLKTHTRVILTPHFRFLVQEIYQLLDKTQAKLKFDVVIYNHEINNL